MTILGIELPAGFKVWLAFIKIYHIVILLIVSYLIIRYFRKRKRKRNNHAAALLLIPLTLLILSGCQKNEEIDSLDKVEKVTLADIVKKHNLKLIKEDSTKQIARQASSAAATTAGNPLTDYFSTETKIYFDSEQEMNDFLSYVGDDPDKVVWYYQNHPDFYQRQLEKNGLTGDGTTATQNATETKCAQCLADSDANRGAGALGWEVGNFCGETFGIFNRLCCTLSYDYDYKEVSDVVSYITGWKIGFSYTHLLGVGSFTSGGTSIDIRVSYQLGITMVIGFLTYSYDFPAAMAYGTYDTVNRRGSW